MTCVNQADGKAHLPRLKPAAMIDFITPPDELMMIQIIQAIDCAANKIFTHRNSFLIIGDLSPLAAMYRAIRNHIPRFIGVHFAHICLIITCTLLVGVILSYIIETDDWIQRRSLLLNYMSLLSSALASSSCLLRFSISCLRLWILRESTFLKRFDLLNSAWKITLSAQRDP